MTFHVKINLCHDYVGEHAEQEEGLNKYRRQLYTTVISVMACRNIQI